MKRRVLPVMLACCSCLDFSSALDTCRTIGKCAVEDAGRPVSSDGGLPPLIGGAAIGALSFGVDEAGRSDHGRLSTLPQGFGTGDLTVELWVRPEASLPVGACTSGKLVEWCDQDELPDSSPEWWFKGNFVLDGHNNDVFSRGSFSLQFFAGGRVRWLFGDGARHLSVGAPAAGRPSLLDGRWHHLASVRRGASLELWVDGVLTGTTAANTGTLVPLWASFPADQQGWFIGGDKFSALGRPGGEDFKGELTELRLYDRARAANELSTMWNRAIEASTPGLVAWFRFGEGTGNRACSTVDPSLCFVLFNMRPDAWRR